MFKKLLKPFAPAALLILSTTSIQAAETLLPLSGELKELDNLYSVEVVLFKQKDPAMDEEKWRENLPPLDYSKAAVPLFNEGVLLSRMEELSITDFALIDQANRLNKKGYQVLYHNSWLERFSPGSKSSVMILDPMGSFEGTINIERQRYLHVNPVISYYPDRFSDALPPEKTIRLNETRRMKSTDLHYIDHPVLGMLVLFRPIKDSAPDLFEEPTPPVAEEPATLEELLKTSE